MPDVSNRPRLATVVTVGDVTNPNLLVRLLREVVDQVTALGARLDALVSKIQLPSLDQIRFALQSSGANPINVTGLRGILADPQPASTIRYPSIPVAQELQVLRDSQLITVKNGAAYDLYTVIGGNPNTLFKLIGGASGGNMMTTDTTQTVTGFKTWDGGATSSMGIALGSNAGFTSILRWLSGGIARWTFRKNATAESGGDAGSDLELIATSDGGGVNTTVLRVTRSNQNFDILSKNLLLNGAKFQSGLIGIKNTAGTIQHLIGADVNGNASNYVDRINGANPAVSATPQVAAGVGFTAGAGVVAATTNILSLDVAAQTVGDLVFDCAISFNSTTTALAVDPQVLSRNVNGVVRNRIELVFTNGATGAAYPLTNASIPAGAIITIRFIGTIF